MTANHISPKIVIELTTAQAQNLQRAAEFTRALVSPQRVVVLAAIISSPKPEISRQELKEQTHLSERELINALNALEIAEMITVTEREPRADLPELVQFNASYFSQMPTMLAALQKVTAQLTPSKPAEKLDERQKTLGQAFKKGKLVHWPAQTHRQEYIIEEIAKKFEKDRLYPEAQVDQILKQIYEEDHCIIRRSLVDWQYLKRENGIYSVKL